uniref:PB1 domain-containing protein n=1 Tax=Rhodosorus marinus TaxID=101924 RepID=A0A7S3AAX0_9RHOD|mmetsp:Transcript_9726/g.41693  ORF Transcript_9726/g.41693 Transcript_9726/m.41693 type:complete len:395 (+) Transcript_9726:182-1366(+)
MGSENVHVKVSVADEMRRFSVGKNVTYEELMSRLGALLGDVGAGSIVSYEDDEGDMVNVTSTLELQEALELLGESKVLRLKLSVERESGEPTKVPSHAEVPREVPESPNTETGVKVEFENVPNLDSRSGHPGHGHGHGRRGCGPGWRGGRGRRRYGPCGPAYPQRMPGWNGPGTPWPGMGPYRWGMNSQASPWAWQSPQAPPPPPPPGPHHGPRGPHGPPPPGPGTEPPFPYPFGPWDTGRMAMKLSRMWQMVDDEVRISLHHLIQKLGQSGELSSLSSAVPEIWPVVSEFGGKIPQGADMPRQEEIDSFEGQLRSVLGTRISASSLDVMMAFMKTALQQRAVRYALWIRRSSFWFSLSCAPKVAVSMIHDCVRNDPGSSCAGQATRWSPSRHS